MKKTNNRYQNWMNKQIKNCEKIHYTKKSRQLFTWSCIGIYLFLLVLFVSSTIMFSFAGLTWDGSTAQPDNPSIWAASSDQILLIIFGTIVFLLACSLSILITSWLVSWYKESRANYMASNLFTKNKKIALKDKNWIKKKTTIKWYKKLGYITKDETKSYIEKLKQIKKTK